MSAPAPGVPEGYHTVTPYLVVPDVRGLREFLERAFGAETLGEYVTPDGRVMHAEAQIGSSRVMMGEPQGESPPRKPVLHLYVEDVDTVYRSALEAGATSIREPETMFYGDRSGGVEDRWGNEWWIATRVERLSPEEIERRHSELEGEGA